MTSTPTSNLPTALEPALRMALAGRLDMAEQCCKRLAVDRNIQADSLKQISNVCFHLGKVSVALELLRRATRISPKNVNVRLSLAAVHLTAHEYSQALPQLECLTELRPESQQIAVALAQTYAAVGDNAKAGTQYVRARNLGPLHPENLLEMSRLLLSERRYEEMVPCLEAVLQDNPRHIPSLNDLGVAFVQTGRLTEAAERFEQVIAIDPTEVPARINLSAIFKQTQRYPEALEQLRVAEALMPGSPTLIASVSQALNLSERYQEAKDEAEAGLKIDPESAELHHSMGVALRGMMCHREAMTHFEIARTMQPRNYSLLLAMGNTKLEMGEVDASELLFQALVEIAPQIGAHHRSYASVHTYSESDPHILAMETLASQASDEETIDLHFALGKAYEDCSQFEEAFRNYASANESRRRSIAYDEQGTNALFDLMTSVTGRRERLTSNIDSNRPIFVVGMPRSGTTLIEQILASHPLAIGLGERNDWQQCLEQEPTSTQNVTDGPSIEWLTQLGNGYLASTEFDSKGFARSVDKMPSNFFYVGLILQALPNAKIVHVRRDPVDTCLSCFFQHFSGVQGFAYDLSELGRFYKRYAELMADWRAVVPATQMLEVDYESVVTDFESQARRLIDFCGLPWHDDCLNFHQKGSVVLTASATQVRKPIYQTSIRKQDRYAAHLGPLLEALR